MTKNDLINIIARNKDLKAFCKTLCRGSYIADDLHQVFLLQLCEKPEAYLFEKFENLELIRICYGMIKNINKQRIRDSKWSNSSNPLVDINSQQYLPSEDHIEDMEWFKHSSGCNKSFDFNEHYAKENDFEEHENSHYNNVIEKFNKTMDFIECNKQIKKYHAVILFSTVTKTTKEIAEKIGVKERVLIYQNNKIKNLIKANVK